MPEARPPASVKRVGRVGYVACADGVGASTGSADVAAAVVLGVGVGREVGVGTVGAREAQGEARRRV